MTIEESLRFIVVESFIVAIAVMIIAIAYVVGIIARIAIDIRKAEARATDSFADLFRRVDRAFERACPPDGAYDRITDHIRSEEGSCAWPRYGSVASIREPRT